MRKPAFDIKKEANQHHANHEADQRHCFGYTG